MWPFAIDIEQYGIKRQIRPVFGTSEGDCEVTLFRPAAI
jgi:hypothetical protein